MTAPAPRHEKGPALPPLPSHGGRFEPARRKSNVPIGPHSVSTAALETERFLARAKDLGVSPRALAQVSADLRPAENEAALRAEVEAALPPGPARAAVLEALEVAKDAHRGQTQTRKKDKSGLDHIPYSNHPIQIARLALSIGLGPEALQAALLHDVVEDTPVTLEALGARFSTPVLALVADLTKTKEESRAEYLARVASLEGDAALIKGLDRYHNLVRAFSTRDAEYLARYLDETRKIYVPKFESRPELAPLRAAFLGLVDDVAAYADALR